MKEHQEESQLYIQHYFLEAFNMNLKIQASAIKYVSNKNLVKILVPCRYGNLTTEVDLNYSEVVPVYAVTAHWSSRHTDPLTSFLGPR
jgi:hypothetical protein